MSDFDEIQTANVLDEREEITRLRAENEKLKAAFRVNMLRHVPNITHEEINAVIADASIRGERG